MVLEALTEAARLLVAALVFAALLLASTYFIRFAGGFGLQILGVNITGLLFYYDVNPTRILNLAAAVIGFVFSARSAYRLVYMKSGLQQRQSFFRKDLFRFAYLSFMLGLALPYLIVWVCTLWRVTKGYLVQGPVVF